MLPFLKSKKSHSVATVHMAHGGLDPVHEEEAHGPELMEAAMELIAAVHSKDSKAVADALCAAFYVIDAEPHEGGPHEAPEHEY